MKYFLMLLRQEQWFKKIATFLSGKNSDSASLLATIL
jgi:hypothetical protein